MIIVNSYKLVERQAELNDLKIIFSIIDRQSHGLQNKLFTNITAI